METNRFNQLLVLSVAAVVFAVYWQALLLPFIQDDWGVLRFAQTNHPLAALTSIFDYKNHLFFRPLARGYLLLMYGLFGPNPIPFHAVALVVHVINSWLVASILNIIVRDRLISYLAAVIYAGAVAVHLDPLAWAVGIHDVGGAFFFFMSMRAFLGGRPAVSAILYFLGCLVKEQVVVLPIILFFYPLLMNPIARLKETIRLCRKQMIPFLPPMAVVVSIRMLGTSPFALPAAHPYVIELAGVHVLKNMFAYPAMMFQSFFPFLAVRQPAFQIIALGVALVLSYGVFVASHLRGEDNPYRRFLFLVVWLLVGLSPVLFLPNHTFRYYGTYSLPAFIGSFLFLSRCLLSSFHLRPQATAAFLIFLGSFAVVCSTVQGNRVYREGVDQHIFLEGANGLVKRAAFVDIVRNGLARDLANPPNESSLVIGGADLWSFDKDSGPQFWYNNGTIHLYDLSNLKFESGRPYLDSPMEDQEEVFTGPKDRKVFLDPSRLFVYRVSNGQFIRIDTQELNHSQEEMKPGTVTLP